MLHYGLNYLARYKIAKASSPSYRLTDDYYLLGLWLISYLFSVDDQDYRVCP